MGTEERHVYDYVVNPGSVGALVPRMVGSGRRVLELGTGPGAVTKILHSSGCSVAGIEIDCSAIDLVSPYCERVIQADLNDSAWVGELGGELFDAVVATDVFEHLYDPLATLSRAVGALKPDGFVVLSLPHVAHSGLIAGLLDERFDYQPWGLLDRTHIRFFGLHNVVELVRQAGLKIVDVDFVVKLPEQTEFSNRWRRLSPEVRAALASNPYGNVYQIVVKAKRRQDAGREVDIFKVDLPGPAPGNFGGHPVTRYLIGLVSLKNRQRIANVLRRFGFPV